MPLGGSRHAHGRRWRRDTGGGSEARGEDFAQRLGLTGGVVAGRPGQVLEATAHVHDGGVEEAGEVAQQLPCDAGAVLIEGSRGRSGSAGRSR